jgi:hypothetical protein
MKQTKFPLFGGSGGWGIVIDQRGGSRAYLKLTRFDAGGGVGVSSFKVLVLFQEP